MKRGLKNSIIILMSLFFLLGIAVRKAAATWSFVDGGLTTCLNYSTSKNAIDPALVVFNNELYVTWTESTATVTQIRVKKYNGSAWF